MKMLIRSLALLISILAFASAEAKTIKYDLSGLNSSSGNIQYPRLDFFGARSAILTVTKTTPFVEVQLTALEIVFPNAAKLTATNFKLVEGNRYRATVNGAWVFKEVFLELDLPSFEPKAPAMINVFVSERTAFINPIIENPNPGSLLFMVSGALRDITATRIVDTGFAVVNAKKVTLSLKDRLGVNYGAWTGTFIPDGFIVDVLWYGKGTKTLYLAAPIALRDFDYVEVLGLIVEGSTEADLFVSVKYKDLSGSEMISQPMKLKDLLDGAYGPSIP